jgi:hypothetical protein
MGLVNWWRNKHMRDPIQGRLLVTGVNRASMYASYSNCALSGVVSGEGLEPTAVEHRCTAPTRKWPRPGGELPVVVDRAEPSRLSVQWDGLPTHNEIAAEMTQRLAAQMRNSGAVNGPAG